MDADRGVEGAGELQTSSRQLLQSISNPNPTYVQDLRLQYIAFLAPLCKGLVSTHWVYRICCLGLQVYTHFCDQLHFSRRQCLLCSTFHC